MSEYQYYEFQAIDRPLGATDREALRSISTRARITATSFTNSYEWGNFKGDPAGLMDRWFDLHLYWANWGSRRFMIRVPRRSVNRFVLDSFLGETDCAGLRVSGENLILDITCEELESDDLDDGSGWLAALAPLRADVLAGDLRLFYLLWLTAVEADAFEAHEPEPMPGIGPMTPALEALAAFLGLDVDLVQAAAERSATVIPEAASSRAARDLIATLTDREKTGLLARLFDGDPQVAAELRVRVRQGLAAKSGAPPVIARTVDELRVRAGAIRCARESAAAEKLAIERRRQAAEAERADRKRLEAVAWRGETVWCDLEAEIKRRNAAGYDKAARLLRDLRTIAAERGAAHEFVRRLRAVQERHARKRQFLTRIAGLG